VLCIVLTACSLTGYVITLDDRPTKFRDDPPTTAAAAAAPAAAMPAAAAMPRLVT